MRWSIGCAVALSCAMASAMGGEVRKAEPEAKKEAKAESKEVQKDPSKEMADRLADDFKKRQELAAMASAAAAAKAASGKQQTLSEQIKDALDGRGGGTLSLGKPGSKALAAPSESKPMGKPEAAVPAAGHGAAAPSMPAHAPALGSTPRGAHVAAPRASGASRAEIARKAMQLSQRGSAPHWDYQGEHGPEHWADIDPSFSACRDGKRQSPILIESDKAALGAAEDLGFDYKSTAAFVVDNGHTLQVDMGEGSSLIARGEYYKLVQFQFHHPSEELIDYKGYPMVAHLVHKSDMGKLAVVAIEFELGEPSPALAAVFKSQPLDVGDRSGIGAGLDPSVLLPPMASRKYYQFLGSLTTPPCSEGVLWMVMKTPMTISREQLAWFAKRFPMNARPVQPLNGRLVREQE